MVKRPRRGAEQAAFGFAPAMVSTTPDAPPIEAPLGGFGTILADPAWEFGDELRHELDYLTMSDAELLAFAETTIGKIAAADCLLGMWITGAHLFVGMDMARIAGFRPIAPLPWVKTVQGTPVRVASDETPLPADEVPDLKRGGGHYVRHDHEALYLFARGAPVPPPSIRPGTTVFAPHPRAGGKIIHSRKPAIFRTILERIGPSPRIELFAREAPAGWTAWGNQAPRVA